MNKHTPGPWRVEMEDDTPVIWAHPNEYDISVCEIGWEPIPDQSRPMRDNGTAIGNARLIAAAPDMLAAIEAVEFILRKLSINPKEAEQMADTLKRAAGEIAAIITRATEA